MAPVATSVRQAELLKIDGNVCFQKERFAAAIDAYTEAITLCPDVPVYWTNRALCYRKRNEWTKVEDDCRKAIALDHSSIKGHYMLGLALLEREEYGEGINELEKALDLERGANPLGKMAEEIRQIFVTAKYDEWDRSASERASMLHNLKDLCEKALIEHHFLHDPQDEDGCKQADNDQFEQLRLLDEVFRKAALADTPTDIPDYLCCKITLDVFRDPVITPSGVTYERAVILEHLRKLGRFDPTTREPLEPYQLVPNLAIKAAVRAYLDEHGWAYKTN